MRSRDEFILWTVCVLVLFPAGWAYAADGVLYLSPVKSTHAVGDTFQVEVLANTDGASITAAEADLTFDSSALEVEDVSIDGSVLGSWPTPPTFSNTQGTIGFSGTANTQFNGVDGLLTTITFKALRNVNGSIHITSGAMLAADSVGTNIITSMRSATFSIRPKDIVPALPDASATSSISVDTAPTATSTVEVSVLQPVFTQYESAINIGAHIIIKGSAPADAKVSVWIERGDESPEQTDMMSAPDGSFTFVSADGMQAGAYRLWAQAIDSDGIRTATSTVIQITVGQSSSLAASAGLAGALIPSSLLYLLIIGSLGFGMGYLFHRRGTVQ